ncbi:MAG: hypothetical protein GXY85_04655 [Candidatus Brocadiaceae bacterium]|nr:hypothetical protein [Candidatus Brocadiaceae bacterium]
MDYLIVTSALCGFFSAFVAGRKGRSPVAWWFVGALLPGVGCLLSLAVPARAAVQDDAPWPDAAPPAARRRPARCCGRFLPDCYGCPHFRRRLFAPEDGERSRGRCEFYGKELEEVPDRADSIVGGGER